MQLKIMTFNIHHGKGTDGQLNLRRITDLIKTQQADLIGLNEVDRNFSKRSDNVDQISSIADQLPMDYAYGPALSLKTKSSAMNRQYGNALLSQHPITFINNYRLRFRVVEDRALLETKILIGEQPVKVYVTHLSLDPLTHKQQTKFILKTVQRESLPVIILGDWNMRPRSKSWHLITAYLQDAWAQNGEGDGHTYPSYRPHARLDYIFLSHHFQVKWTNVVYDNPEASDHLPVVATVNTHFC
mgnify:CR=1 FL=1